MAQRRKIRAKGRGLNSIPLRFALMALVMSLLVAALTIGLTGSLPSETGWLALVLALGLPPLVNYLAASRLSGMINELHRSTLALGQGDYSRPVEIDCSCEVGDLADGFRAMAERINSNVLRMNMLAYIDPVTGLPNRAALRHIQNLARAKGAGNCAGAMLFIDIDGFKRINDSVGQDAGDDLLRQVGQRLIRDGLGLTPADIDGGLTHLGELSPDCPTRPVVSRLGGNEFIILLPHACERGALTTVVERIEQALDESFAVQHKELFISASIGIARLPDDTTDPDQLLTYADIAMMRAKELGGSTYAFFDASLRDRAEERALIERELHLAVVDDLLTLHYQPKVNARTKAVTGVEALVRWDCPGLGPVPPETFIRVAEQCGLMIALGESILRMAVRQARYWADAGMPTKVAVNVSPVQFERAGLASYVMGLLRDHGLDPALIELEITEGTAMADFDRTAERVGALRKAGIAIAIDDFGVGYSNLSQLARLDFDTVKIDRSLVSAIGTDERGEAMLGAVVSVSRALGRKVIAEGVESAEQMARLTSLGCDELQGYLLARPMPADAYPAWLAQHQGRDVPPVVVPAATAVAASVAQPLRTALIH